MPAQIRPTRLDVTDRFPDGRIQDPCRRRPIARRRWRSASIPACSRPKARRTATAANFYSTRGNGGVRFRRRRGGYTLPPEVLARFIGNEKLYFGLATAGDGGAMKVAVMPSVSSPYISIKGLSGRSMARVRVLPNRQQRAAGYGSNGQAQLEWAGDTAQPGMTPVANGGADAPAKNGKANGASPPVAEPYDDGFGPMPGETPAAPPAPAAPTAQGLGRRQARGFDLRDDPEARGIEGPAYTRSRAAAIGAGTRAFGADARLSARLALCRVAGLQHRPLRARQSTASSSTSPTRRRRAARSTTSPRPARRRAPTISSARTARSCSSWPRPTRPGTRRGVNSRSVGIEHVAIKQGGVDYPRPNGTMQHFDHLPPTDTQYCEFGGARHAISATNTG